MLQQSEVEQPTSLVLVLLLGSLTVNRSRRARGKPGKAAILNAHLQPMAMRMKLKAKARL